MISLMFHSTAEACCEWFFIGTGQGAQCQLYDRGCTRNVLGGGDDNEGGGGGGGGSARGRESRAVRVIFSGVVLAAIGMVIGRAYLLPFGDQWRFFELRLAVERGLFSCFIRRRTKIKCSV